MGVAASAEVITADLLGEVGGNGHDGGDKDDGDDDVGRNRDMSRTGRRLSSYTFLRRQGAPGEEIVRGEQR